MRVVKKYFYPIAFSMLLFSSSAMAKVHPSAYMGVTELFYEIAKFYSLTLGEIALSSGLIEDIRFHGPFIAAYNDKGERLYTGDGSSDPLWNVVKLLFPSNNGQLGTETTAITNFAKYVKNPKTVALLINYAKNIRENEKPLSKKESDNLINKVTADIIATLESKGAIPSTITKSTIKPLLKYIAASVAQDKEGKSIYPTHTIEQVLSAFFCYQFNKQEEIWELLRNLDDSLVNKEKLEKKLSAKEMHYLEEKDLPKIASKETYDLDDVLNLSLAELWKSPTPYKEGVSLLNNGNAFLYDRAKDLYVQGGTFADCVETMGRHIANLLLFNAKTREFDLTNIKEVAQNSPYFKNFLEFYKMQTPIFANAGDIGTRSLWNKVLADLNPPEESSPLLYVKKTNELRSGFINFIRAFQKAFNLPLPELPEGDLEDKKEWVEESLKILFSSMNAAHEYDIDLNVSETENDLSGDALVTVKNPITEEDVFSFNLFSSPEKNHSEMSQLKILKKKDEAETNYASVLKSHKNTLHEGTEESVWLVAPAELKEKIHHPFYKLFSQALADNESKINFIDTLGTLQMDTFTKEAKSSLSLMIENVLKTLSWDDEHVVRSLTSSIAKVLENTSIDLDLKKAICNPVQSLLGFSLKEEFLDAYLPLFTNLKSLNFANNINGAITFTIANAKLETIGIGKSTIEKLEGLEYLTALKEFRASRTGISELTFSKANVNLRKINVSSPSIKKLEGLEYLTALEEIYVNDTKNLSKLAFSKANDKVVNINIQGSAVGKIEGLENLSALETVYANDTKNLTALTFSKANASLTAINVSKSSIAELRGLKYLTALKDIDASNTENLLELRLPKSWEGKVKVTHKNIIWEDDD